MEHLNSGFVLFVSATVAYTYGMADTSSDSAEGTRIPAASNAPPGDFYFCYLNFWSPDLPVIRPASNPPPVIPPHILQWSAPNYLPHYTGDQDGMGPIVSCNM